MTPLLASAFLAALVCAAMVVRLLSSGPLRDLVVDTPNQRSLHVDPVPRIGGLGLLGSAFLVWAAIGADRFVPLMLVAGALVAVSFADDVIKLSAGKRLVAHFVAAILIVIAYPAPNLAIGVLAVFTFAWMANLYNFMDGSDGLAGGMALIGFGAYGIAAALHSDTSLAVASVSIAGAAAGFLIWNFPKARIFMGDSGSVPIGFLAGVLGYLGWRDGIWPFYFPALVFLPFIADASVTLLRRAKRGERLSEAHASHYYQRLNRMGLGHRGTALWGYAVMIASSAAALLSLTVAGVGAGVLIIMLCLFLGIIMRAIDKAWADFQAADTPSAETNPCS